LHNTAFFKGYIIRKEAFCFGYFTQLSVQPIYSFCSVHDTSNIITKTEIGVDYIPVVFPGIYSNEYLFPHFFFRASNFASAIYSFETLCTALKTEEHFLISYTIQI